MNYVLLSIFSTIFFVVIHAGDATPDQKNKMYFDAIQAGNIELVHDIIQEKMVRPNMQDGQGNSALHVAVIYKQLGILHYLLRQENAAGKKSIDVDLTNEQGCTALHVAVKNSLMSENSLQLLVDLQGIAWLLNHGACPDLKDVYGLTALHYAAVCGKKKIINKLLDGFADPTICTDTMVLVDGAQYSYRKTTKKNITPFDLAIMHRHFNVAACFKASQASSVPKIMQKKIDWTDVNKFIGVYGFWTAPKLCVYYDDTSMLQAVLGVGCYPIDIDELLRMAVCRDSFGCVQVLLDHGANPNALDSGTFNRSACGTNAFSKIRQISFINDQGVVCSQDMHPTIRSLMQQYVPASKEAVFKDIAIASGSKATVTPLEKFTVSAYEKYSMGQPERLATMLRHKNHAATIKELFKPEALASIEETLKRRQSKVTTMGLSKLEQSDRSALEGLQISQRKQIERHRALDFSRLRK